MQEQGAYVSAAIESSIDGADLTPEDKRFASALVLGVVQTHGVLHAILDQFLEKPGRVRPDTRRALEIAAYEMLFLGKEPQHAVDQGVRLAGKSAPYARGLANAVLRRVADLRDQFPFGDPASSLEALCVQEGFPEPLASILVEDRGWTRARRLIQDARKRPPVFIHVNAIKAACDPVEARLAEAGIQFDVIEDVPGCLRLGKASDVAQPAVSSLIQEGSLIVSDLAAQLVAWACVRSGLPESLLEIGAGRGTKTVLIQSMAFALHGQQIPEYVCVDNVAFKRHVLLERLRVYGVMVSECLTADGRSFGEGASRRPFALVLIDAPCTGIGTLRRHPEIIWNVGADDVASLASLQRELLQSAASLVAPQGRLLYSTCTVSRAEDEAVVEDFLSSPEGAAFAWASGFATVADGWGADSHFAAIMDRLS